MSRFGFSTEPSSGGDFLPIVKYDARAGRLFRVDREQDGGGNWVTEPVDITHNFKAIVDFENVEVGWISFSGGAPDFRLVPMGEALPAQPPGKDDKGKPSYRNGIRFMLKLSKECGGEKPIREVAGVAKAFLSGVESVFADYEAARAENPGKLPVLTLKKTTPIKSGNGEKQSTNYVPVFEIAGWAPRGDLVFQPKNGTTKQVEAIKAAATAGPPSTGSTRVEPPKAREPAMADDDNEFG